MNDYKRIKNRSEIYQVNLLEISYPHELLDIFSDQDSVYKRLNPFAYDDEIAELQEQLNDELWRIIEENLTERQKQVVKLSASGKTQIEIAKLLKVNQSSVTKCEAGETLINLGTTSRTIKDIWTEYHIHQDLSSLQIPILCFNEDTKNSINTTTIKSVFQNGSKPLLSITTATGKQIRTTADHRFYTPNGWMELHEAITNKESLTINTSNGILYDPIASWRDGGEDMTYDIEVTGPYHNFFANDIVIHNCINGNVDYKNKDKKGKPITYGGVRLKLQKIVKEDPKVNAILKKIADLRDNEPF